MYFLDYLKDSSRLEAENCMYRILMAGKYDNVGYFKYWLWGPFHNSYHARPFLFLFCVKILLFGVFFHLIKLDEVGKPIGNETLIQFWHYEEFFFFIFYSYRSQTSILYNTP